MKRYTHAQQMLVIRFIMQVESNIYESQTLLLMTLFLATRSRVRDWLDSSVQKRELLGDVRTTLVHKILDAQIALFHELVGQNTVTFVHCFCVCFGQLNDLQFFFGICTSLVFSIVTRVGFIVGVEAVDGETVAHRRMRFS